MKPHGTLIGVALLLAALGAVVVFLPGAAMVWRVAGVVALVFAAIDALLVIVIAPPGIERRLPASMSLSSWSSVNVSLRNENGLLPVTVAVYDHHPGSFEARGLPLRCTTGQGKFTELKYRVRPTVRGQFEFGACDVLVRSPLSLWWRKVRVPLDAGVRVYPNYSTISKLLLHEADNPLALAGIRLRRRRGQGTEFEQLREYREGDPLRSIDWKATARMSKLIAREYQDERDQQVVFILDAGRRMLAKDQGLSHFDHALNAMILLSYIALRHGDAVGIMAAGAERRWLAPRKGMAAVNALLNGVYDLQPQAVEVDYIAAATELAVLQRRRSLVIFLTNVREEDSDDLHNAMSLLRRRHLVVLASLREQALDDTLYEPVAGFRQALKFASTEMYLQARQESQRLLKARGVFVEDCLCDQLPTAITNQYLRIKRAGML